MKYLLFVLPLVAALAIGCGDKTPTEVEKEKEKPRLKGEGYGDDPFTAPLKARWTLERRLKVDMMVAKGLQVYKAVEGHTPRNQKEFEQMIKQYDVVLPTPQEGFRYEWNVKEEKVDIVPVEK